MNTQKQINETTLATTAIIVANICNQILEFQASISARTEGSRFPSMQEVGLLCKLINCLDKLKKFTKQTIANQVLNGFIRFLAKDDKELSKIVRAKFREYTEQTETSGIFPGLELQHQPESEDDQYEPENEDNQYEHENENDDMDETDELYNRNRSAGVTPSMLNDPSQPLPPICRTSPIDVLVLADHIPVLGYVSATEKDTVPIMGIEYNTHWIQYNLFQCSLPLDDQRFFADEYDYHHVFNHAEVMKAIRPSLKKFGIKERW